MIVRHPDVAAFRERVESWLLASEVEHNLILSLIERLGQGLSYGDEPPYFLTVEQDGAVRGCAIRTPPYLLSISHMPAEAVEPLAREIAGIDPEVPSVLGPEAPASAFGEAWSAVTGRAARLAMRQRIYELTEVIPPPRSVTGRLRKARKEELDLLASWGAAFDVEAGLLQVDARKRAQGWLDYGKVFLWEDGPPVTMAAVVGGTPRGARIGFVYTPKEHRGRGYGTACTAALSQRCLDEGRAFCCLYTDIANPTSNRIYRQIGYRPVCDVAEARFGGSSGRG